MTLDRQSPRRVYIRSKFRALDDRNGKAAQDTTVSGNSFGVGGVGHDRLHCWGAVADSARRRQCFSSVLHDFICCTSECRNGDARV